MTEERKNAEEVDLLLEETQHRVNNALAVVHAIAYQTPTKGRSAEDYRNAYLSRLDAFLSTENLISRSGEQGVTLSALVEDALQAVTANKIDIAPGPVAHLVRAQARPLRMIFHELTTNAFKYGALSQPEGIVHVSCEKRDDGHASNVALRWREEGGPLATPPVRHGFGVAMIERTAKNNGWEADTRFDPKGLQFELVFPAARPKAEPPLPAASCWRRQRPGRRVFLARTGGSIASVVVSASLMGP